MKTHCQINSAVLEFVFDPGWTIRVYVDTSLRSRDITAHAIDPTGLITRTFSPASWESPDRIIADISRNDLKSVEAWANKHIEVIQRDVGWLVSEVTK